MWFYVWFSCLFLNGVISVFVWNRITSDLKAMGVPKKGSIRTLFREHRRLYPGSERIRRLAVLLLILEIVWLVLLAVSVKPTAMHPSAAMTNRTTGPASASIREPDAELR